MLEETLSLLLYAPFLVPVVLLFVYAFSKTKVTKSTGMDSGHVAEDMLIEKDH